MPSNTFFNLPVEKQEKLLEAATREFSRRSFSEASINQIIKDAGIPRGSFYMYFTDKEDLFHYLLQGYVDQLLCILEELLLREQGDLFQALLDLFDYIGMRRQDESLGGTGAMAGIIRCNSGMQKNIVLDVIDPGEVLERLGRLVNVDALYLREDRDLSDILAILLVVAGPMIYNSIVDSESGEDRAHLCNVLDILKRGMAKAPVAAIC